MKSSVANRPLNLTHLRRTLGVTDIFIQCMIAKGFEMTDGRSTVALALRWLKRNGHPFSE